MESKPTHEQAQLHLQIYEERREPRPGRRVTGSSPIASPTLWTKLCASLHRERKRVPTS